MARRTTTYLTKGERKVLSLLMRRGPKTWTEILRKTGLSRSGLSKVLHRLRKTGLVEETLIGRHGRKVKAYRSVFRTLEEADLQKSLATIKDEIAGYTAARKLRLEDLEGLFETILTHLQLVLILSLHRALTRKSPQIRKTADIIARNLGIIVEEIRRYPELYDAFKNNYPEIASKYI